MHNVSINWLVKLQGAGSLTSSTLPKTAKPDIDNLIQMGVIQRTPSGAGFRYSVADSEALRNIISARKFEGDIESLTPKARAVALHGDAHRGRDDSLLLMLAGTEENTVWTNGVDELDVFDYSSRFGVASLVAKKGDNWRTNKPIALVENLDLLVYAKAYFDKIGFDGTVLYYSGMVSGRLLDWLHETPRAPSYVMFPDYDIVGLANYLRIKQRTGNLLRIYIPSNLERLLSAYGHESTLSDSKADRSAIESTSDKDVLSVYNLMLKTGKTLHQEALMIHNKT